MAAEVVTAALAFLAVRVVAAAAIPLAVLEQAVRVIMAALAEHLLLAAAGEALEPLVPMRLVTMVVLVVLVLIGSLLELFTLEEGAVVRTTLAVLVPRVVMEVVALVLHMERQMELAGLQTLAVVVAAQAEEAE